jgi:hypothetical protein
LIFLLRKSHAPDEPSSWPILSVSKLVDILSSLERYWNDNSKVENENEKQPPKITHSVKVRALQLLSELSLEEREALGIYAPAGEGLIRKIYEDVLNPHYNFSREELIDIYKQLLISRTIYHNDKSSGDNPEKIIGGYFSQLTQQDMDEECPPEVVNRILKEVNRIGFQSGAEQLREFQIDSFDKSREYTSIQNRKFAKLLTKCIIENEEVTDEFPIRIKFISIEKVRPLPLIIYSESNTRGLINSTLLDEITNIKGLERQYSYRVAVHLLVRNCDEKEKIIEFSEEVTGIGSPMSHIRIAIDRMLMWDIPCLKEYFPVARQHFSNDEVMGDSQNSPIWSHCAVQLYKRNDVKEATNGNKKKHLEEIDPNSVSHYGEYCGFDLIETSAKAALIARLRAIKYILAKDNVSASEYIEQIWRRKEEYDILSQAKDLLQYFPFSLGVMIAKIDLGIFTENTPKYRQLLIEDIVYFKELDKKEWSLVAYSSHLKITESLLREGRIIPAKMYLDALEIHKNSLSDLMLARYYLCWSQYYFLFDLETGDVDISTTNKAITKSNDFLKKAEQCLKKKIQKCELLGEISHSNTHPFFELYSKISICRAKMSFYFSGDSKTAHGNEWRKLIAPLQEAEKARVYAARDGNTLLYLMLAFTWDFKVNVKKKEILSKEDCIIWANRLLIHSVVCYEEFGLKSYAQIKRNAGLLSDSEENIKIDKIPFIQEYAPSKSSDKANKNMFYEYEASGEKDEIFRVFCLDFNSLKTKKANPDHKFDHSKSNEISNSLNPARPIFFGTDSSILIFTEGMIDLCHDFKDEKDLLKSINKAMRKFIIAWSTSRDGAYFTKEGDTKYCIQRIFDKTKDGHEEEDAEILEKIDIHNDRYVRGLYPNRISETALLSKLFIAVCLMILETKKHDFSEEETLYKSKIEWSDINKLMGSLHESDMLENLPEYQNQDGFNKHLSKQVENLKKYAEDWGEAQLKNWKQDSLSKVRDEIVKNIFLALRGEENIMKK